MDGEVVAGPAQAELATPPQAAARPQTVAGSVTPVPGEPAVPTLFDVELVPEQVPSASPSTAAATAQVVSGTSTGTDPVDDVANRLGSQEFDPVPATAATTLHTVTGSTTSIGAR